MLLYVMDIVSYYPSQTSKRAFLYKSSYTYFKNQIHNIKMLFNFVADMKPTVTHQPTSTPSPPSHGGGGHTDNSSPQGATQGSSLHHHFPTGPSSSPPSAAAMALSSYQQHLLSSAHPHMFAQQTPGSYHQGVSATSMLGQYPGVLSPTGV